MLMISIRNSRDFLCAKWGVVKKSRLSNSSKFLLYYVLLGSFSSFNVKQLVKHWYSIDWDLYHAKNVFSVQSFDALRKEVSTSLTNFNFFRLNWRFLSMDL